MVTVSLGYAHTSFSQPPTCANLAMAWAMVGKGWERGGRLLQAAQVGQEGLHAGLVAVDAGGAAGHTCGGGGVRPDQLLQAAAAGP